MRAGVFVKLWKYLTLIRNRDRIPRLPRMFASEYHNLTRDDARVMARYGFRSPSGVRVAMRRHGVQTVEELIAVLEHYRVRRNMRERLRAAVRRLSGGVSSSPHAKEIRKWSRRGALHEELRARVKRLRAP